MTRHLRLALLAAAALPATLRADDAGPVELQAHRSEVWCLAFSPDGKQFASASKDGTVQLRDAAGGEERHVLKGHKGDVLRLAFSPDGNRLASSGGDGTVHLW